MKKIVVLVVLWGLMVQPVKGQSPQAATLIDDFDSGAELASVWWSYTDDLPQTDFGFSIDQAVFYNGTGALRLDLDVAASGYAGIGFDYGSARDWREGQGIVLQMRASQAGLPIVLVVHVEDETQTSEFSPGVTPFGAYFVTPPGSEAEWVAVTLLWEQFERLTWLGTEGLREFRPQPIVSVEIAFEATAEAGIEGTIWIDDMRVISERDLNTAPHWEALFADLPVLKTSQVGYRPADAKLLVASVPVGAYRVEAVESGEVVYEGETTAWGFDEDAGQVVYWGRFDSVTTAGTYRIVAEGVGESYPFTISETAYHETLKLTSRVFYLQRSGIAIQDGDISGVELEAGHLGLAVLWDRPDDPPLEIRGGWYDAGDYGRYMPTGAFAVNQLLLAYETAGDFFGDGSLNIPESGNGLPDLLDEIRWELEWMLEMQRNDGAVYHKITTRRYPEYGALPSEDTQPLYVFGVSSADTAYFAAVMAQAGRVFVGYDAEFAARCLEAAQEAWVWLEFNAEQVPPGGFQNPPSDEYPMQGGYDFVGEESVPRLWAAGELYRTTGEAKYEAAFGEYFEISEPAHSMNWANSYPMGLYAYLKADSNDTTLREEVARVFEEQAGRILEVTLASGYGVALNDFYEGFEYIWGSNQVALAHGLYLMMADEFIPNERYREAALGQIQYVLGVNPLAKAYISGVGSDPMLYPHHNVSFRLGRAVPGFVTEGANSQSSGGDAVVEALWEAETPPALCYGDDWDSWATNEPTIDANATFVALLAYFV